MATLIKRIRDARDDEGFSLVELAVVALVILALLAIALPTFLGAQDSANDRQAQSNLRNTLAAADIARADAGGPDYSAATHTNLANQEVAFAFVANTAISADPNTVSVQGDTLSFRAAARSKSGTCYSILKVTSAPVATDEDEGVFYGEVPAGTDCSADEVDGPVGGVGGNTASKGGW